jgi:hypothetical protein
MEPLVEYYRSISGEHPDWDDYGTAMIKQRRCLIRITPTKAGSTATGSAATTRLARSSRQSAVTRY